MAIVASGVGIADKRANRPTGMHTAAVLVVAAGVVAGVVAGVAVVLVVAAVVLAGKDIVAVDALVASSLAESSRILLH